MSVEQLSYEQIGQRLGASPAAARALVRRLRLPRLLDNSGRALVSIDFAEIAHNKRPVQDRPADDQLMIGRLRDEIAALESELAAVRQRAADDRSAGVAERKRCDRLISTLAELTAMLEAARRPRPWWRWLRTAGAE